MRSMFALPRHPRRMTRLAIRLIRFCNQCGYGRRGPCIGQPVIESFRRCHQWKDKDTPPTMTDPEAWFTRPIFFSELLAGVPLLKTNGTCVTERKTLRKKFRRRYRTGGDVVFSIAGFCCQQCIVYSHGVANALWDMTWKCATRTHR